MKVKVREGMLVFVAEDSGDALTLRRVSKVGHLHFCCKRLKEVAHRDHGPELWLAPSLVRWQRPEKKRRTPRLTGIPVSSPTAEGPHDPAR